MIKEELNKLVDDFIFKEYESEKAKKTIQSYKQKILSFINWLPENESLNKSLMIKWKEEIQQKFAPTTQNVYIVSINKFLYFCDLKELILKKVKIQNQTSLNDQIEESDHSRMLRWAKKLNMMDMYYIIRIFAEVGIRVDELKQFKVETLNWSIKLYNKGKNREMIVPSDLIRDLKKFCKDNEIEKGYIFRSPRNKEKPLPTSTIWERLKRIAKRAKINPNKIHAHAWRHLYAIRAKAAGIDIDELRDLLGHTSIETTALYTKTSSKEKRKKIESMRKKL